MANETFEVYGIIKSNKKFDLIATIDDKISLRTFLLLNRGEFFIVIKKGETQNV